MFQYFNIFGFIMLNKFNCFIYDFVKLMIFKFLFFFGGQFGNFEILEVEDWDGWVDYVWSYVVILDEMYGVIKRNCNFSSNIIWDVKECKDNVDEVVK